VKRLRQAFVAAVTLRALIRLLRMGGSKNVSQAHDFRPGDAQEDRSVPANPHAELLVAGLLVLAATFGFGFTAVYVLASHNTQLLGLAFGTMLALLSAAAIVAGKFVVPQETSVEERDELLRDDEPEEIVEIVEAGGEGISRRALLAGAGGLAGAGLVTAAVTPVASLGPRLTAIHKTPWHRGVRLVDEDGRPYSASDIQIGSFYTALPEGAYWEQLGAPLLVVKLPPAYIRLPAARRGWAPQGILAYSKICTHATCAISLYRYPTFAPTSTAEPAFTCPCHYSTFLPGEGGRVIFGPAGRPLPQLPVLIDQGGDLRAAGGFDEDVGPAWLDVRRPGT
jgi:ubiquinol-cytochrome c reductase iron-sulfur subunit